MWRGSLRAKRIIHSSIRWKIGNSSSILIFDALWLSDGCFISGEGHISEVIQQERIHSLIQHNSHSWNYPLINHYLDRGTAQRILNGPRISSQKKIVIVYIYFFHVGL